MKQRQLTMVAATAVPLSLISSCALSGDSLVARYEMQAAAEAATR